MIRRVVAAVLAGAVGVGMYLIVRSMGVGDDLQEELKFVRWPPRWAFMLVDSLGLIPSPYEPNVRNLLHGEPTLTVHTRPQR